MTRKMQKPTVNEPRKEKTNKKHAQHPFLHQCGKIYAKYSIKYGKTLDFNRKMQYDKYDYLIFENTDDYILQNLRDKSYYQQLIEARGKEMVFERETFL